MYHNFGTPDGELILQPPIDPNFLGVSPVDLHDGWSARKLVSEAPDARLYSIESSEAIPPAADGQDAGIHSRVLGRGKYICNDCGRWLSRLIDFQY